MVGDFFGFAWVRVKRWQVIRDPDRLPILGELVEQIPGFFHGRVDDLFVR